jgi:N-acetylglucosaminyldiphosphoundecaprenol N-acetyl-beta-D-mannosaminyltransferase
MLIESSDGARANGKKEGSTQMRTEFLGVPIDAMTFEETVARAVDAMRSGRLTQHVALNVAKLVKLRHDPDLRRDVVESHIVGVDGMGIVWGARALGVHVPERVAGVDLMQRLLAICAREGFRPYFFGARPDVLEVAISRTMLRWPRLRLAGYRDGYEGAKDEAAAVAAIQRSEADCLFIGMPTPQKERFLHAHRLHLGVPFIMGVGGGIDVLAGHVARAPAPLQRIGLEWLYRIYQEPRRMWWRYLSTNMMFAGMLGKALVGRALRRDAFEHRFERGQ